MTTAIEPSSKDDISKYMKTLFLNKINSIKSVMLFIQAVSKQKRIDMTYID